MPQVLSRIDYKGWQAGREEGRPEAIQHRFERNVGPLDEATNARVQALGTEGQLALIDASFDLDDRAALDHWLASRQP